MGIRPFAAALVGATALFAAAPATALTLTFAVQVTNSSEGAPAIADFSMDWTFEATFGNPYSYFDTVFDYVATPQGADMLALIGLDASAPFQSLAGMRTFTSSNSTFGEFSQQATAFGEGSRGDYRNAMFLPSPPGGVPVVEYTDAGLVNFLLLYGPLSWTQTVQQMTGNVLTVDRRYAGVATLVAVDGETPPPPVLGVPEPTTWALMILGFGAAGAMLRRRSAATA